MQYLKLTNEIKIPILGFGTWNLKGSDGQSSIEEALEVGYRHIDTADSYGNHHEVGQALKNSGIKRDEIFLTSKIQRRGLDKKSVLESGKRFQDELGTPYIDLLLIHWPSPDVPVGETLEAMAKLKEEKIVRTLGVSNFGVDHLKEVLKTGVEIVNNQIELHPTLHQKEIVEFCKKNNITVTAYSPLGRGFEVDNEDIHMLAKRYARTPAQVILRWIIQQDIIAIPKALNPQHIKENFKVFDFELTHEDMELINQLPQNGDVLGLTTS